MNAAATHGLLVDDDPLYLRTLQRTLARRGIEAVTATDISSAMQLARQVAASVLIMLVSGCRGCGISKSQVQHQLGAARTRHAGQDALVGSALFVAEHVVAVVGLAAH